MLLLCLSMVWAKGAQSFVYKVLQNGEQVGHRNVVITYLPSSKKQPDGATQVEIESDITLSIAGQAVRYHAQPSAANRGAVPQTLAFRAWPLELVLP